MKENHENSWLIHLNSRIREISGLEALENLEELYIADNGLKDLKGLGKNNLQTIEIANNKVLDLSGSFYFANLSTVSINLILTGLEHMSKLEELWANNNEINSFQEVDKLTSNTSLLTVYFEHNPIQKDPQYRRKLKLVLPSLTQIDATLCKWNSFKCYCNFFSFFPDRNL